MKQYGIFRWKLKGTFILKTIPDTQLKRFQPKTDHEYLSACVELRRIQAREGKLSAKVRRLKTIRDLVRSEVGRRKAQKCPCHILTGKYEGSVLCLARRHNWENLYKENEFYFWICSHCRMGDNYKVTKALLAKLTGEYTKYVVNKSV